MFLIRRITCHPRTKVNPDIFHSVRGWRMQESVQLSFKRVQFTFHLRETGSLVSDIAIFKIKWIGGSFHSYNFTHGFNNYEN